MEIEEVKEIKEKLKEEIFIANSFGDKLRKVPTKELEKILALINELENENERLKKDCADIANDYQEMGGFYYEEAQKNQQLKDKVTELESENKELRVVVDIANERTYRKKFIEEWRKEYQKELDKQGEGHIAGFPDFDLVYKLYFEQKDRIVELEDKIENGTLVEFPFCVFDKNKNKEADCYKIALKEDWAKCLCYCDMEGFAITQDGMLILLDECGRYTYCPDNRFKVVAEARLKELQES